MALDADENDYRLNFTSRGSYTLARKPGGEIAAVHALNFADSAQRSWFHDYANTPDGNRQVVIQDFLRLMTLA